MKKYRKNIIKILFIGILCTILIAMNIQSVEATVLNPDEWDPHPETETDVEFSNRVKTILGAINTVGVVVSVITLMIIGIRIMFGSVEERASYKESLSGYVVGAVLLVAVTTIPNLIYNFMFWN